MFKIEKTNREFQLIKWVLTAKSKESSRYAINGLYVENHRAVCTDGRRLHIANIQLDIEDGLYEVITNTAKLIALDKMDGTFPKFDDIIPVSNLDTLEQSDDEYLKQLINGVGEREREEFVRNRYRVLTETTSLYKTLKVLFAKDITLSIPFIMDVLGIKKPLISETSDDSFKVIASVPEKPVQFSNGTNKTAVVMPITLV